MIIESLGVYLPPKVVSTADVLQGCKKPVAFPLEKMTGIRSRRMAGDTEFSIDLARQAINDCLARSKYKPEDIDLLICCNISRVDGPNNRTTFEPSTSIRLRRDMVLDNAVVFDVSNACAGLFTGIAMADGYLKSGAARRALVVSGEYISHLSTTAQKEIESFLDPKMACLTVGDSGVAMILEPAPHTGVGFQDISLYTLGRYSNFCIAKPTDQEHGGAIMVTDSIKSSAIAIGQAVMHSTAVLERNGWALDSFQHLIMHQTSETALLGAAREINQKAGRKIFHPGNVINNLAERGNTATTTHFVAVMDNIINHRIRSGDRVAFGVSGSGQITGMALYVFDDLPDRIRKMKLGGRVPEKVPTDETPARTLNASKKRVRIDSVGRIPTESLVRGTLAMAKVAAEDCLARSSHDRSDIDLLLFVGVYRDEFICEPAIAAMAAGELKINDHVETPADKKTFALDVFNGAIGFLNACHMGAQMIEAGKAKNVMVLASEVENNAHTRPDHLRGIKETGSAMILDGEGNGKTGFGNFVFHYVTKHIGALETHTAMVNKKTCLEVEKTGDLAKSALNAIPEAVVELLVKEGLTMDQIQVIFPPQVSSEFTRELADRLQVPAARMVDIAAQKDYFTSSLACSIRAAQDTGKIKSGDIGLFICMGAGLQIGCAIYYF
jgi:3-oxoacyl-[acyl-carrier-protein] synthase III